jgi:hypothetical protein
MDEPKLRIAGWHLKPRAADLSPTEAPGTENLPDEELHQPNWSRLLCMLCNQGWPCQGAIEQARECDQ